MMIPNSNVLSLFREMMSSNFKFRGRTPLLWAILVNNTSAIRTLIRFGADVEATDNSGATIFMIIARSPNPSKSFGILTLLLEEIKSREIFREHLVVSQNSALLDYQIRTQRTKRYIETLANVPDHSDRTPLMIAAFNGLTDVVRLLIASGATMEATGSRDHLIFWAMQTNSHSTIRFLEPLTRKDVVSEFGENILHQVASFGDHKTISIFLQFKLCCIDTLGLSPSGHTPLEYLDIERPVVRSEDEITKLRNRKLFLQLLESIKIKTATVNHDCVSSYL